MAIERLSASNAAKHMACHASANLEEAIPGFTLPDVQDTKASSKGTDMHYVLELAGGFTPAEMLAMAEAMKYVALLRKRRRFQIYNELKLEGWWLKSKPNTKVDVALAVSDELHIVDYKFGKIPVDVNDNAQLKYYALAATPLAPKATGVTVHIVQPLAGNIEAVWLSKQELELFMQESIAAEVAINAGDVTFNPTDNCKFCPANPHGRGIKGRPLCPALMQLYYPQHVLDEADALS